MIDVPAQAVPSSPFLHNRCPCRFHTYFAVLSHTYGPMNGTSMATPITSGASAMVLSLLGASDGNYFKAEQVQSEQGG